MVDGVLCDGGAEQPQGWIQMPNPSPMASAAAGAGRGTAGPVGVGVPELLVYDRYLTTTEMLGAYRGCRLHVQVT
jgi:hypothetical protein